MTPFKGVIPITPCVSYVVYVLGFTVVLHVYAFSLARKLVGKRECNLEKICIYSPIKYIPLFPTENQG